MSTLCFNSFNSFKIPGDSLKGPLLKVLFCFSAPVLDSSAFSDYFHKCPVTSRNAVAVYDHASVIWNRMCTVLGINSSPSLLGELLHMLRSPIHMVPPFVPFPLPRLWWLPLLVIPAAPGSNLRLSISKLLKHTHTHTLRNLVKNKFLDQTQVNQTRASHRGAHKR